MSSNLNVDQQKCRQRCREKSSIVTSNSDVNRRLHSLGVLQSKQCSRAPFLHIPLNLRSSEFIFQKTRSVSDVSEVIFEYFMAAGFRNEALNSPGKNVHDTQENIVKAETGLNGLPNDNVSRFRLRSASTECLESSELTNASSKKLEKVSECSPYQSTELSHESISKARLRCLWKDGSPNFVFAMDDNWEEVFVANPYKNESITDEALEYTYLFHARKCRKKGTEIFIDDSREFVAKMNVSTSLVLNSCGSKVTETEFVLFVASEDRSMELKLSSSDTLKAKSLSKKMSRIFKPNNSFKKRKPSFQYDELAHHPFLFELCNLDGIDSRKYLELDFPPNLELAAVVVKDFQCSNTQSAPEIGGWGLKFLQKVKLDNADARKQSKKIMNVIVPAGFHGGLNTRIGGQSSLTQRWRSGGHCECGGWDLGCPLTVLHQVSSSMKSSPGEHSKENTKSAFFFTKGGEKGEPILRMVNDEEEGVKYLYFNQSVSALQCFSIGVAIIHSQTQALNQKF